MVSRISRLSLVVLVVLVLSGCSAGVGTGDSASAAGGAIELAVSQTCAEEADPQCVQVNGENVVLIKIGGEIQAAVVVMEAMAGDHVQISVSPDDNAQKIVDLIHKG